MPRARGVRSGGACVVHGLRWMLVAFALLCCVSLVPGAEPPRIYAITNATVVAAPGRTIEGGTVVIRDGLIEAVGAGLPVPPDAVEIDGTGRWVYPGLIDADSSLGLKAQPQAPSGGGNPLTGGRARTEAPAGAVHSLSRVRPETRARDRLVPFSGDRKRDAERVRKLGITTVLASPEKGILRGRSVAILLVDDRPVPEIILRDDVAQHAAFERGGFGQGYPSSLMGAVAALRQALLDTRRHATWSERYSVRPAGMSRPEMHAAYEALAPVLTGRQPLIVHTDNPQDTLLAAQVGREFGLQMLISTRSHEWEIAGALAESGRGLMVSVSFPDKPKAGEDDEALEVSRDEMRRYLDAAAGPGRLHDAGVRFAFTLHGLKNSADFPKQMRKIIDAGLSEEAALAAWTTVPAEFLQIDRMVGSLEPGKIANVLVADGPLFAEKTHLSHVFVDGEKYEIEVKEGPKGDPDAVVDPRGEWSVTLDIGGRIIQRTWTISGQKDDYAGTAETQSGTVSFEWVTLAGNVLTVAFPARGGRPGMEVTVIVEGDHFEGTAEMGPRSVEVQGTRTSGPEGDER